MIIVLEKKLHIKKKKNKIMTMITIIIKKTKTIKLWKKLHIYIQKKNMIKKKKM